MRARITVSLSRLFLFCFVVLSANSANASFLVDQSVTLNEGFFARFGLGHGIAQSFMQAHNTITGASVLTHINGTGFGDVTISLYDALPPDGGTLLATGTAVGINAGEWATVDFGTVSITPEQTYFLVFDGTDPNMGVASTARLDLADDYYTRGLAYHTDFGPHPLNDINFETFYFVPSTVPEPSTLVMIAGAIICASTRRVSRAMARFKRLSRRS